MLKNKKSSFHDGQAVDTLIGAQVVLQGDLQFSGGLVVEGRIHGRVFAAPGQPAMLTLAEQGVIEGQIDGLDVAELIANHSQAARELIAG